MNFYSRLWLLAGVFLLITRCEVAAADDDETEVPESEGHDADTEADAAAGDDDDSAIPDLSEMPEDPENPDFHQAHREEDEEPQDENLLEHLTTEHLENLFKKFDTNGDGKVTWAEVHKFAQDMRRITAKFELEGVLKPKDKDGDGKLTLQEFQGEDKAEERQDEMAIEFKDLDHNHDNFVDADELANLFHHHTNEKVETKLTYAALKEKDLDNNGVLSMDEFYHHVVGTENEHQANEISDEDQEIFNKLDTDASGTLTLKELRAWESGSFHAEEAVKKLFHHADKDSDDVLTADEIHAARSDIANDPNSDTQMYLMQWAEGHGHAGEL